MTTNNICSKKIADRESILVEIVKNASVPLSVSSIDGVLSLVNSAFENLTGYAEQEIRSINSNTCFTPNSHVEYEKTKFNEVAEKKKPVTYEKELIKKDGSRVPVEIMVHPLFDTNESVNGFLILTTDISERKKNLETLRKSVEQANAIITNAPIGIATSGFDTHFLTANKAFCKILGYSEKELRSMTFKDITHKDDFDKSIKNVSDLKQGKKTFFSQEKQYVRKDGSILDGRILVNAVYNSSGVPSLYIAELEDITDRKKAEHALNESKSWFDSVFASMNDAVITFDASGKIIDFNKAYLNFFEYKGDILHKSIKGFYSMYEINALGGKIVTFEELPSIKALKGKTGSEELVIKRRDTGKEWITSCSYSPVNVGKKQVGAVLVLRNVTNQKLAEILLNDYSKELEAKIDLRTKELRETQELLLKTERFAAIGELAGMIGHDLRNPLTSIKNAVYLLRKKGVTISEETYNSMLGIIENGIFHSDKIINDLLDYSKDFILDLKQTTIEKTLTTSLLMTQIPEKIKIKIDISPTIQIVADENKLGRVFVNIIKNAIDAMPTGGCLTIKGKQTLDLTEISFTDTGLGIPDEVMTKIFSPLVTTKAQGMGFGLAICKRIIEAHGGTVDVKTIKGAGTTFIISFPKVNNSC